MYKIAVMGDYDSIYGFAAVGLDTYPLSDEKEAEKHLHQLVLSQYAVIYITEEWAARIPHAIDKYKDQILPAIIQIPGVSGNTGKGVENVKKFVETAVGSDILFSNNK